jgi:hypothetical protein
MRFLHWVVIPAVAVAACGGAAGTGLDDGGNNGDGGGDGSTTQNDGSSNPDVIMTPDTGTTCPVEAGKYSLVTSGAGCGNTATTGFECITQTQCTIDLAYIGSGSSSMGLKDTTPIQLKSDGSFDNGAIQEGTANRSGCVGTWDQQTHTLIIDCGGVNTSQSCRATLVRVSETCG